MSETKSKETVFSNFWKWPEESESTRTTLTSVDELKKKEEIKRFFGPLVSAETVRTVTPFSQAMKELESKKLLNDYKANSKKVEELAMSYIHTEIHHPVITCFRELIKTDFSLILSSTELKRPCNNLEFGLICLGMLDYFAMALDNPLYSDNNKNLSRVIAANSSKILAELKIIFNRWRVSGNAVIRNRCDGVLAYLRLLGPKFAKIKDFDFNELVDSLVPDTVRRNRLASCSSSEPEINSASVSDVDKVVVRLLEEVSEGTDTSQESQERPMLMELKINTSIFEDNVDLHINTDGKTKSRIICNKLPSPPSQLSQNQQQTPIMIETKIKNTNGKQRMRPAPAKLTRVLVPPPEIVDLDCEIEIPTTKKPRLELGTPIMKKDKPVVNAFAVLMNRSKEIALANKLRRAGIPPN